MKLTELKDQDFFRIFVMGEPGTGKSVGASTFPSPILFYDFDKKISSVYGYWKKHDPKKLDEIEFEDCSIRDDKGTGFKLFNQHIGDLLKKSKDGEFPYKTIVIDSVTIMASEMLQWLVEYETGIKRNKDIKSRKVASMQDYMIFAPTFTNLLYELFKAPAHIICTGHIKVDKDELTGEIIRSANIPGQTSKNIPIYFPEVYVSMVKQGKYLVQTEADYKYPCRTQLIGIPKEVPFKYEELIKYK